jgi:hypothetical protein
MNIVHTHESINPNQMHEQKRRWGFCMDALDIHMTNFSEKFVGFKFSCIVDEEAQSVRLIVASRFNLQRQHPFGEDIEVGTLSVREFGDRCRYWLGMLMQRGTVYELADLAARRRMILWGKFDYEIAIQRDSKAVVYRITLPDGEELEWVSVDLSLAIKNEYSLCYNALCCMLPDTAIWPVTFKLLEGYTRRYNDWEFTFDWQVKRNEVRFWIKPRDSNQLPISTPVIIGDLSTEDFIARAGECINGMLRYVETVQNIETLNLCIPVDPIDHRPSAVSCPS